MGWQFAGTFFLMWTILIPLVSIWITVKTRFIMYDQINLLEKKIENLSDTSYTGLHRKGAREA